MGAAAGLSYSRRPLPALPVTMPDIRSSCRLARHPVAGIALAALASTATGAPVRQTHVLLSNLSDRYACAWAGLPDAASLFRTGSKPLVVEAVELDWAWRQAGVPGGYNRVGIFANDPATARPAAMRIGNWLEASAPTVGMGVMAYSGDAIALRPFTDYWLVADIVDGSPLKCTESGEYTVSPHAGDLQLLRRIGKGDADSAAWPYANATATLFYALIGTVHSPLYSNGELDSGPLSDGGLAAPEGTHWSEVQSDAGNTAEANAVAGFAASGGSHRLADDFVVPADVDWTLTGVEVPSFLVGLVPLPAAFVGATLEIWKGRPGDAGSIRLCGDTTTNVLTDSTDAGLYRIANTAVPSPNAPALTRRIWRNTLSIPAACAGEGFFEGGATYWISWDTRDSAGTLHFAPGKVVRGARGRPGDNARLFTVATGEWHDVADGGIPETAPDVPQDVPFQLLGTESRRNRIFTDGFERAPEPA